MALANKDLDQIFQLRLRNRIDPRTTACRITITHPTKNETLIEGYSQFPQTDAFIKTLAKEIYTPAAPKGKSPAAATLKFKLKILQRSAAKFAVITKPTAPLWTYPDDTDPEQLGTEALYGAIIRAWHNEGRFTIVQAPDGYIGYCPKTHLQQVTTQEYLRWKNGPQAITRQPIKTPELTIPASARLAWQDGNLLLPDGTQLKVPKSQLSINDPSRPQFIANLLKHAQPFMDSPYLWGGKSEIGIDCSGFVQALMQQENILLPRDASMQCHTGEITGYLPDLADLLPGDVMFFMNKNAHVFHVGIYLGENRYMHSAGATGPTISSTLKNGENYMTRYGGTFCYARRMHR